MMMTPATTSAVLLRMSLRAKQPAGDPELSHRTTINCVTTLRMTFTSISVVLLRMSVGMKELKGLSYTVCYPRPGALQPDFLPVDRTALLRLAVA